MKRTDRGRKPTTADEALKYKLETRVTIKKYLELQGLLHQNPDKDMSSLIRDILDNRPIKLFTRDLTLDNLMEELSKLRMEIKSIGVNINQITRLFNTYPERYRKEFYAKTAFAQYQALQPQIEQLLKIISKLAKRWLSE